MEDSTPYIRDNMSLEYYMKATSSLTELINELQESIIDDMNSEQWRTVMDKFSTIINASEMALDAVAHVELLKSEGW